MKERVQCLSSPAAPEPSDDDVALVRGLSHPGSRSGGGETINHDVRL
jgi:hypothetical protein